MEAALSFPLTESPLGGMPEARSFKRHAVPVRMPSPQRSLDDLGLGPCLGGDRPHEVEESIAAHRA